MGKLQMALRLYVSGDGVLNEKDQMVLPRKPSGIDDVSGLLAGNRGTAVLFRTGINYFD